MSDTFCTTTFKVPDDLKTRVEIWLDCFLVLTTAIVGGLLAKFRR